MNKLGKKKTIQIRSKYSLRIANLTFVFPGNLQIWIYWGKSPKLYITIKFVIQNCYVGISWKKELFFWKTFICLIPCFPIIIFVFRTEEDD